MSNHINENGVRLSEEARMMFHRPATELLGRSSQDERIGKRKKKKLSMHGGLSARTYTLEFDLTYIEKEY